MRENNIMQVNSRERQIIQAMKKMNGGSNTKRIAANAGLTPQTTSKYLSILEVKNIVKKDDSLRPHIMWQLTGKEG
jgi:predicted transcriptional regulator